ncbi:MAG TPA: glycogen debranching enzyme, partial [Pirellulales bacterium]
WRGESFMTGHLATRLAGSADLYQSGGRQPYHSINFVTSHDGFTVNDLVTYARKHNEENGEGNRDGDDNNYGDNYGIEGPTRRRNIDAIRERQIKNFLATLLLSQGVPMLLSGDECRRTQRGNNNAYCQDNPTSWFDWRLIEKNASLVRFVSGLIALRRANPTLRRKDFLRGEPYRPGELPDVSWYNAEGTGMMWERSDPSLTCVFGAHHRPEDPRNAGRHVMLLLHAGEGPRAFTIPPAVRAIAWRRFIDTAAAGPLDIFPEIDGPPLPAIGKIELEGRSLVCFVAAT